MWLKQRFMEFVSLQAGMPQVIVMAISNHQGKGPEKSSF